MAERRRTRVAEESSDLGDAEAPVSKEPVRALQSEAPPVCAHTLPGLAFEQLAEPGAAYVQLSRNVVDGWWRGTRVNGVRHEIPRMLRERFRIFVLNGRSLRCKLCYQ